MTMRYRYGNRALVITEHNGILESRWEDIIDNNVNYSSVDSDKE